jgi:branched-chain amino acid transport system ATP-binding protein
MLTLLDVTVEYGQFRVLHHLSMNVESSKLTAVVGTSGAGKSTLLKTIMGWVKPTSGMIKFDGENLDELPTHKRVRAGLACVPEGRRLFPDLTVLENLDMGAFPNTVRKVRKETLHNMFERFPSLESAKNRPAKTLSGGEQQLLAISRALMSRPKLLILDEPSLGLAPKTAVNVFAIITELVDDGLACLLLEQNVEQALRMADDAFLLDRGNVLLHGDSAELRKAVSTTYLAD